MTARTHRTHGPIALLTAAVLLLALLVSAKPAHAAGTPRISAGPDMVVGEADGTINVPVTLSESSASTVTVNYNTIAGDSAGTNDLDLGADGTLTFIPGDVAEVIPVTITNDGTTSEGLESFRVTLDTATNATIVRASTLVSIIDNETLAATPGLFARDVLVDESAGQATIPVILGGTNGERSNSTVTVDYTVDSGTATVGSDLTDNDGNLSFAPGQNVKNIVVDITDDNTAEGNERFTLNLTNPTNATIADGTATVVIGATNPETKVGSGRLSLGPDMVVGENTGYVDVPVTLAAPVTNPVTVNYKTDSGDSAGTNDIDLAADGTLNFASGETTKTVRVEITNDTDLDSAGLESFRVTLDTATNATIVRASTLVSIIDNETLAATPGLFARDVLVDESAGQATIPVILGGTNGERSNSTVTVDYTVDSGTATVGSDLTDNDGNLSFAPGQNVKNIVVDITDDNTAEGNERFTLNLTNPTNATIADGTATVVIGATNPETKVGSGRLSLGPDMVVGENTGYVDVPVTLAAPVTNPVTVNYKTDSGDSAGTNDIDLAADGTLNFASGETTKTVRVEITNDTDLDSAGLESFRVTLDTATNATIVRASTLVSIIDNETLAATPGLFARDVLVDESAGQATIPVILGGTNGERSNSTVTVDYTVDSGTATVGSDLTDNDGNLSFAPGQNVKNIVVDITDDNTAEGNERFTLNLTNPTNATIADGTATVVIGATNPETKVGSGRLSLGPDMVVGENTGYVDVPVTLAAPVTNPVTVNYITNSGDSAGTNDIDLAADGTLNFASGETTKTVRVEITNDTTPSEGLESFTINIATPTNATITAGTGAVTIIDDDSGFSVYGSGIGDDAYTVTAGSDQIVESPFGGTDSVSSSVTYTLPANVEHLTLTGGAAINGTGNAGNNHLIGNGAANVLSGLGGADVLEGMAGGDTLKGGTGSDTLTGGADADKFVFGSVDGSDTVTDFGAADKCQISQAGIRIGDGDTTVDGGLVRPAPGGFATARELVIFTSNISGEITATKAAAKIGNATAAYATGANRLFVVDNGVRTAVFRFRSSGGNAVVGASELTLVTKLSAPSTTLSRYAFVG